MKMKVKEDMTAGEVLDKYPKTLDVFLKFGFTPLKDPVLRKTMPYKVTIKDAAMKHGVDLRKFLEELNRVAEEK